MTESLTKKTREKNIRGNTKTTREDWLSEARRLLLKEGVDHVKVDRLAKNMGVTRGGFYWFFKNRQDLLNILLAKWKDSRNDPFTRAIRAGNKPPLGALAHLFFIVLRERSYSPELDAAVRDWARTSKRVRLAIDQVDNCRITALTEVFQALNYKKEEAFIRARIFYFHQVGYYAMNIHETPEQRLNYLPVYFKQLTGFDLPDEAF